jgi:hypothetical protein
MCQQFKCVLWCRVLYADPVKVKRYLNRMEREGVARVKVSTKEQSCTGSRLVSGESVARKCQERCNGSRSVLRELPESRSVSKRELPMSNLVKGGSCQGQAQYQGRELPGSRSVQRERIAMNQG